MCGRIIQSSGPLQLAIVDGLNVPDSRVSGPKPRYNGAPSQELLVIRENHGSGQRSIDLLRWGLIPHRCADPAGGRKPINAKAETVSRLPTFRDAYARRRCIVPIDGFFEWHATREGRRPYAIAMRDGSPFAVGALWENWKSPITGHWVRTFCIITTPANVMVSRIHDRMPLILARGDLDRWLGPEQDPGDLLRSYPSADMRMWPISTRVNSPNNDDPSILEPATASVGA
jgi:putative SOS response-associated peptidase YedK